MSAGWYDPRFISGLAVGESMSGVVAALLTAMQRGLGFGPSVYFLMLAGAVALSAWAFWLLQRLPACRAQLLPAPAADELTGGIDMMPPAEKDPHGCCNAVNSSEHEVEFVSEAESAPTHLEQQERTSLARVALPSADSDGPVPAVTDVATGVSSEWHLLLLVGWASCWQNGVVPATLPYATKPYGGSVYLWANSLSLAVDPLANLLPLWYRVRPTVGQMGLLTVCWTMLGSCE